MRLSRLVPVAFPVLLWGCTGVVMGEDSGLKDEVVESETPGTPVVWSEFAKGEPANVVAVTQSDQDKPLCTQPSATSFWHVRHAGWVPCLLNAVGTPPDLTLDPGVKEDCDIYLGFRAVDPVMTFGIKLSSEAEFTVITAPAATASHHFNVDFHWKARVPMAGEKIVLHAFGKPVYLLYIKFVPYVRTKTTWRAVQDHVAMIQEKGRHFAFPGVAELQNGDLLAVCREGDAHVCPRGRIVMSRSTDGGKSWSPRETIFDSPSDERDPAILCLADGTVVVSLNTWDSWHSDAALCRKYAEETAHMEKVGWGKYSGSWLMVSKDNGKTWTERRKAPVFSPHGPVVGPEDALYWVGHEWRDGASVVAIHRTADLGLTWTRYAEVSYSRPEEDGPLTWEFWDEPNLIFLPGGKAICTIRVGLDGFVRQSYSNDGGKTWSWPKKLLVWGFPQHLCRLADGRVLLSYGYRREPRGIRACISADDGRTYDLAREIVLRHGGGNDDLGYPYAIQRRDGSVFTAYYYNDKGGDCYIEGVCYRP